MQSEQVLYDAGAINVPRAPGKPATALQGGSPSLGAKIPSESSLGRSQGGAKPRAGDARGRDVARLASDARTGRGGSPQQSAVLALMTR